MELAAALELADAVVTDGFGVHRRALAALLAEARRRGTCEVLVAVAADADAPPVARERALGRIIVSLARPRDEVRDDKAVA